MSAYESVQGGGLKLKGTADHTIKKKKKKKSKDKDKEREHVQLALTNTDDQLCAPSDTTRSYVPKKTKAELAYEKAKEKRQAEQILTKASTNHKERIMEFNKHLDTLTEHFDIPKVSWTK